MYVNYGRIEDFRYLTLNKSIDLKGKTLIARYGKIFRGDKVRNLVLNSGSECQEEADALFCEKGRFGARKL